MFVLLFLLWITLNGRITVEICAFGVVFSLFLTFCAFRFMGYDIKREFLLLRNTGLFIAYVCVLLFEIVKANTSVMKLIFSRHEKPSPVLVCFDVPLRSKAGRVLLANSITLTPGTISVKCGKDGYLVHCLRPEFAEGIDSGTFVKLLMRMEKNLEKKS